jgi:hypothetical protein
MKKKSLLMTAVATLGLTAATMAQNVPNYVPTNGLVGWWPFNGNVNDESGNGNNGNVNGASLTTDRFGNSNAAYIFDGVNDYIECTDIGISGSLSRSVSFWAKTTSIDAMGLVNWGGNNSFPNNGKRFSCSFNYATQGITIGGGDCALTYAANVSNSNNQWSYYTFVMNTSSTLNQVQVYQNGTLLSNITHSYYPNTNLNTLTGTLLQFGRINYPPINFDYYKGQLDDIGIWNRALTQQEVSDLYNGNICYQTITVSDTLLINMGITGFNPVTYNNTIKIFPNPTNDHITINYGNFASLNGYQLKIINSLSQQVFQSNITQQSVYLNLATWGGNGLYFFQIIDPQGNIIDIRKILLQ